MLLCDIMLTYQLNESSIMNDIVLDDCALCDGWGFVQHDVSKQCPACLGTGKDNERLDDVLSAVYLAGTENGLSRRLTDAEEIMHRKEAFIRGNPASKEAKQAITSLIKELVA